MIFMQRNHAVLYLTKYTLQMVSRAVKCNGSSVLSFTACILCALRIHFETHKFQCIMSEQTKNKKKKNMAGLSMEEHTRVVGILETCGCNVQLLKRALTLEKSFDFFFISLGDLPIIFSAD